MKLYRAIGGRIHVNSTGDTVFASEVAAKLNDYAANRALIEELAFSLREMLRISSPRDPNEDEILQQARDVLAKVKP